MGSSDEIDVTELREEAAKLADTLPGELRRLRLKTDGASGEVAEVEVEWQEPRAAPPAPPAAAAQPPPPAAPAAPPPGDSSSAAAAPPSSTASAQSAAESAESAEQMADGAGPERTLVTAPMVGTFYRAPEPGADPFVSVGDEVEPEQVVGIVEAMKLMNPITAETGGRVVEILVDNAEPVEFGRALIALAPADASEMPPS